MNKLFAKVASLTLGLALAAGAGVALASNAKEAKGIKAADGDSPILIDATNLALTSTATTAESNVTYGGVNYVISSGAKAQTSSGDNKFSATAILIGKSGAYIYNSTAIPGDITQFEVYANKGASAKVSVGVKFAADSAITSWDAVGAWTQTLSTLDNVYDASSAIVSGARYFRYQVTNANNSQVEFRITYSTGGSTHTHTWVAGTDHAPTCTEAGYTEFSCTGCDQTKQDDVVPALGHDYGEVIVDTAPTCTEAGAGHKVCSRDSSHVENVVIPATGHNYVDGVCTVCGAKESDQTVISLDFTTSAYGVSTTQGNQTLTGDGATYGFEFAKGTGTGAKYVESGGPYVLFGKAGVYFRNTSAPSDSYISAISWTYSGNVSTSVQLSLSYGDAALTAESSSAITTFGPATKSGIVNLSQTDTTMSYFFIYVTNAYNCQFANFSVTWTKNGGSTHTHTWVAGTDHAPTCTEAGYTEFSCTGCDQTKQDDVVPALGHDYGEVIVDTAPTCTEAGAGHKVCSRDSSHVENVVIPATGHNYVDGVCTVCGAEEPVTHAGTAEDPFTVAEALAKCAEIGTVGNTGQGPWVTKGIISRVTSAPAATYWNATYYISDDGTQNNELQVYRGFYLDNAKFDAETALLMKAGNIVTVTGNLTGSYGSEYCQGNYLLAIEEPSSGDVDVTFNPAITSFEIGDSGTFTASSETAGVVYTWAVDNSSILSVDENTGAYEALGLGVARVTVTATLNDKSGTAFVDFTINGKDPVSVSEANEIASGVESGKTTSYYIYVEGYVKEFATSMSGDKPRAIDIMDLEGNKIMVYTNVNPYSDFIDGLALGDYILVKGTVQNYSGTYEITSPEKISSSYSAVSLAFELLSETDTICKDYDGVTDNSAAVASVWESLSDKYEALTDKETLINAKAKEGGTTVEEAMARYDYLTDKYELDSFISGRPASGRYSPISSNEVDSNAAITIITIIAVTSISAIAVLLVVKKRKTY